MATVAIGRDYEPADDRDLAPRPSGKRSPAAIPERNTLWDDPWAVGLIAIGLISLVGISTYLITNALRAKPPVTETTPPLVVTEPTPTPKPSVKPTQKPIASPISFEQKLELTAGKPTTRSGNLKSNQTANLTFSGKQGQTLDAAVNGEGVLMTIFSPEGQPINDRAKRASSWNGALPLTGEYKIQLKTVKKLDSSDYQLDLDLKDPPKPSPEPIITSSPVIPEKPIDSGNPIRNERVLFDPGKTSTQISNSIKFPGVIRYLVLAKAGQTLDVSVQGATLSVLGSDGKPFPDATDRSNWRALLPTSGDYIIEVNANSPFILNVEVK